MMVVGSLKFHRRTVLALNQLTAEEKSQVLEALARLDDTPAGQWPGAKRRPGEPPLYVVPIDDRWRAFVQTAAGQQSEVMDIVMQGTLDSFANGAAHSKH